MNFSRKKKRKEVFIFLFFISNLKLFFLKNYFLKNHLFKKIFFKPPYILGKKKWQNIEQKTTEEKTLNQYSIALHSADRWELSFSILWVMPLFLALHSIIKFSLFVRVIEIIYALHIRFWDDRVNAWISLGLMNWVGRETCDSVIEFNWNTWFYFCF